MKENFVISLFYHNEAELITVQNRYFNYIKWYTVWFYNIIFFLKGFFVFFGKNNIVFGRGTQKK